MAEAKTPISKKNLGLSIFESKFPHTNRLAFIAVFIILLAVISYPVSISIP